MNSTDRLLAQKTAQLEGLREQIALEQEKLLGFYYDRIEEVRTDIRVTEARLEFHSEKPAGTFFTPDVRCIPGSWTGIGWTDKDGTQHRTEDTSFFSCAGQHYASEPKKVLALTAILVAYVGLFPAGSALLSHPTVQDAAKTAAPYVERAGYQILEEVLQIRDKFF